MAIVALFLMLTASEPMLPTSNPLKIVMIWALRGYKKIISPAQGRQICNFSPSCSQFTRLSIEQYGPVWGTVMGADRLLRCNSFAPTYLDRFYFGEVESRIYDPPADHFLLRYDHHIMHEPPDGPPR